LRTYQYGEHLVDRIDFEELALKSVDPSLSPSLSHPQVGSHNEMMGKKDENMGKKRIKVRAFNNSPSPLQYRRNHFTLIFKYSYDLCQITLIVANHAVYIRFHLFIHHLRTPLQRHLQHLIPQ
jgi:hypothetical protein